MKDVHEKEAIRPLYSIAELSTITSLSRAIIYRQINKGTFPQPVRLSNGRIGFTANSIEQWIISRPGTREELPTIGTE